MQDALPKIHLDARRLLGVIFPEISNVKIAAMVSVSGPKRITDKGVEKWKRRGGMHSHWLLYLLVHARGLGQPIDIYDFIQTEESQSVKTTVH